MTGRGIQLEDRVERILEHMQQKGLIAMFRRNRHFGFADMCGRDFTVVKSVNGIELVRFFGVTRSPLRAMDSNTRHFFTFKKDKPRVPNFFFATANDEVIERKVLSLFTDPRYEPEPIATQ